MIASLTAVALFYPIDTIKTRRQVHKRDEDEDSDEATKVPLVDQVASLYKGLPFKMCHTLLSSFVFHFWLQCGRELFAARKRRKGCKGKITVREGLLVSTLAAIVNVFFSLPLDGITTRLQAEDDSKKVTDADTDDKNNDENDNNNDNDYFKNTPPQSFPTHLWRGLTPSICLSTNPAIHYTFFDYYKDLITTNEKMSMLESFFCGVAAKTTATVVTYPLIRTKIKMISSDCNMSFLDVMKHIWEKEDGVNGLYV